MRMKLVLIAGLCMIAEGLMAADSYLCIAEHTVGFTFDKERKLWRSQIFMPNDKYLITEASESVKQYYEQLYKKNSTALPHSFKEVVWVQKDFGIKNDQGAACDGDFDEAGIIICKGIYDFRMNKRTMRFLNIAPLGYWNIKSGPPENIAEIFGFMAEEGKFTPAMSIGRCSLM